MTVNRLSHKLPLLACVVILIACTADEPEKKIAFHAEVSDIEAYSAMITITHNATNRDAYYGITVEGEVKDVRGAIDSYLSSATAAQLEKSIHYQRKCVFRLTRLATEKTYTFIAFGMNDDGKLYGEPAAVVFTTTRTTIQATENPNWNITYQGHRIYKGNDYSLITVSVSGVAEERFYLATFTASEEQAFPTTEELIAKTTNDFLEELEEERETDYWLDEDDVRANGTNFYRYMLPGDYVSYAIGITAEGAPTGHYVKTPVYHVDEYPMDEMYENLVDYWVISDGNKTFNLHITESFRNQTVKIYGWGGNSSYPILAKYNRADGSFTIEKQFITTNAFFRVSNGDQATGDLSMIGVYINTDGSIKALTSGSYTITQAVLNADGEYELSPKFYERYTTGLAYYLKRTDGGTPNYILDRMMFPLTMKKY